MTKLIYVTEILDRVLELEDDTEITLGLGGQMIWRQGFWHSEPAHAWGRDMVRLIRTAMTADAKKPAYRVYAVPMEND